MATAELSSSIEQIGLAAGLVWHELDQTGPLSLAQLAKRIDTSRDIVMQAVGWLAREEKIQIEEANRTRIVSLLD
jgi:DNA-binding GntR family transcriptional regulator